MILKKDTKVLGIIIGLLAPFAGFFFARYKQLGSISYMDAIKYLIYDDPSHRILTSCLTLSLIANAVLFTLFLNFKRDQTAIGIFAATCVYAIFILIMKTF